ncbi:MAG: DUF692 domain-containing protein [Alphaproteobacteria bacterium]|nr:DUF692 domain-containing protein [Alphaproteobacteria bacterium]
MLVERLNPKKRVGVGLRHPHYAYVLENKPSIEWFEVHSENFFAKGGPARYLLEKICYDYPLSLHGVGLSLGSAQKLDTNHLKNLKELISRFSPFLISEHLSWSNVQGSYLPDLLPVPYTDESLQILAQHIDETQSYLKREILIENPSSYIEFNSSTYHEAEFLTTLCQMTGAKILLDINNIYVSSINHGWNASAYLSSIPPHLVGEIHLAGHTHRTFQDGSRLLIDDHGSPICDEVWDLYNQSLQMGVRVPTLIEWDTNIPSFDILMREVKKTEMCMGQEGLLHG